MFIDGNGKTTMGFGIELIDVYSNEDNKIIEFGLDEKDVKDFITLLTYLIKNKATVSVYPIFFEGV